METKTTFTLDTSCSCSYYDEELDQDVPLDYCEGCWEDQVINFQYDILTPWLKAKGSTEDKRVLVRGRGMTWQRLAGEAITTADKLLDTLSFGSDYRLVFTLDENYLTATRYSHDEPMGSSFEFEALDETPCERCGEWLDTDRYEVEVADIGEGVCETCCELYHEHDITEDFGN